MTYKQNWQIFLSPLISKKVTVSAATCPFLLPAGPKVLFSDLCCLGVVRSGFSSESHSPDNPAGSEGLSPKAVCGWEGIFWIKIKIQIKIKIK